MGETYVARGEEIPELNTAEDEPLSVPGLGRVQRRDRSRTHGKFLGREKEGPWVFHSRYDAGHQVPMHKHSTNRTEFLIKGQIEWLEPGREPILLTAGSLTWVEAGTVYGFKVLTDSEILLQFDGPPGVNYA